MKDLMTMKWMRHKGFRSGLEVKIADQISKYGLPVHYETEKLSFVIPARSAKYTPDFKLGNFYVETKGFWSTSDRHRHLLIKDQHPDLDIRFVFSNQNAKLYKGSPTSYAMYCEKHGFIYSHKWIPENWLEEARNTPK